MCNNGRLKKIGVYVDIFEKNTLSFLLLVMVAITFSQVIARYIFNSGAIWALELTTTVFAWLVLLGASHGIKIGAHLGVDVIVNLLSKKWQRIFGLIACLCCLLYAAILIDASWLRFISDDLNARGGAIEYIQKMYKYNLQLEDLPLPRWTVYSILPIGLLLFCYRVIQALYLVFTGVRKAIIASH
jgi:C4-dicarboxylate transporter DctQ subunit